MKQEYIDEFELKIKLNKAIENGKFEKKEFVWILKYLLKTNHYLKKHFKLFSKENINELLTECNHLLAYQFFMNDKILIIWIARAYNKSIEKNNEICTVLNEYLNEKSESQSSHYSNKYYRQLYYRAMINCDDDCFKKYLPTRKSESCYSWQEEKDILYPQFDKEIMNDFYYREDYWNENKFEFNKDELQNIKDFKFNDVSEKDLLDDINEMIKEYENNEKIHYEYRLEQLFRWIKEFENIKIYLNEKKNFTNGNIINSGEIYSLLKKGMFNYDVNDKYFIIDREVFEIGDNGKEYGRINEMKSINEFIELIDFPKWIRYMRSHDIKEINDLYRDEMYDEFSYFGKFSNSFKDYLKYNYSNDEIGINVITNRIKYKVDITNELNKLFENRNKIYEIYDGKISKGMIGYDIRNDKLDWYDGDYYGDYKIYLTDIITGKVVDYHRNLFDDIEYIKECVRKRIKS